MRIMKVTTFHCYLILVTAKLNLVKAFSVNVNESRSSLTRSSKNTVQQSEDGLNFTDEGRRTFFSTCLIASSLIAFGNEVKAADDKLFKPNPLTNPILEQMRISNQAEADNIKYGGELAPGSPKGRETYAKLLIPILQIQYDLYKVDELISIESGGGLEDAMKILDKPQFQKLQFKKTFNAFADNIYYTDPDRANLYLGGGAVPKNEQSIAYLIRNDVLTNLENLQAEVAYMIKEKGLGNPLEFEDLFLYSDLCKKGMVKYLELVPPGELQIAKDLMN